MAANHLMLCDLVLYVMTYEYESKLLQSQALCLVIPFPNMWSKEQKTIIMWDSNPHPWCHSTNALPNWANRLLKYMRHISDFRAYLPNITEHFKVCYSVSAEVDAMLNQLLNTPLKALGTLNQLHNHKHQNRILGHLNQLWI